MIFLALTTLALYVILIFSYNRGWDRLLLFEDDVNTPITVVIAFRNEARQLPMLLDDFSNQNYSTSLVEFIFVDDFSDDNSFDIVESYPIKKQLLKSPNAGKKAAIEYAIKHASNDIILTTDADCRVSSNWIVKMVSPFINNDVQFVFGPVSYHPLISLFDKFQALEFMSLIASGAGAAGNNKAFMCNAANMAFRKSIFQTTEHKIASGDDVFLLHHVKRNNGKICFVKEQQAIVTTQSKKRLSEFINQRKRWASKSSSYKDKDALWSAFLVFSTNFFLLYFLVVSQLKAFLLIYAIKSIVDYFFLKKVVSFFRLKNIFPLFWVLQIIYPFYVVGVAFVSQFTTYQWKKREYSK